MNVLRITDNTLSLMRPVSDASLAGEEAVLRITRTGFSLAYTPLPRAQWRSFPPHEDAAPSLAVKDDRMALFGAFEGDTCVGSACVRVQSSNWAEVVDIRVDAAYRCRGFARMLLDSCEHFATVRGMYGLRISCTDTNPVMCQFCEHCGFSLAGVDTRAVAYTDAERTKPLARRAVLLFFYRPIQKG